MPSAQDILKEAASWYYDVCELYEDDDLDPDDHLEVLKQAFFSSDCDDFADVLRAMTGWPTVRAAWNILDVGFGHHMLVQSPEGRLLDAAGWTDEKSLIRRYRAGKSWTLTSGEPDVSPDLDDNGIDPDRARIAAVIRSLPYAPFNESWFQDMTRRPLVGADVPHVEMPPQP